MTARQSTVGREALARLPMLDLGELRQQWRGLYRAAAPAAADRTGVQGNRLDEKVRSPRAEARNPVGPRVAGPKLRGSGARRRLLVAEHALPLALRHRQNDHRYTMVGAALLRAEAKPLGNPAILARTGRIQRADGARRCRGLSRTVSAAPSTPANPPRKVSNRSSTRSPHSAKPARPTSAANVMRAGL